MRKFALLLMACCLLIVQVWAQTRTITGKVTDAQGKPIPNASIRVKGTTVGTATGANGSYSLSISAQTRTLLVSSIGYAEKEIEVGNNTTLSISLLGSNQDINEVIVVAYGTVKKGDNTGSSAQINAADISKRSISNVTNALTGSAPGIQTTAASGQPGSGPAIRLRGFGSYSLNNDPLILVDGVVYNGGLSNINPEDVESVSTLKDAATTAIYGSRAANGIVQITTKRGTKGRNSMGVKITQGYTERGIPEYNRVDAYQYYPLIWESYRNSLVYGATPIPIATANNIASGLLPRFTTGANAGRQNYNNVAYSDISQLLGYNPFNVASTAIVLPNGTLNPSAQLLYGDDLDWSKQATRSGYRSSYDLNYSGTGEKSDFFGSFGYVKEKGWAPNANYDRFNGRVNVNVQPVKFFRTGFNISGLLIKQNTTPTSGIVNPFYFARYIAPIYPVYQHDPTTGAYVLDASGAKQYDYGTAQGRAYNPGRHSIAENLWNKNGQNRYAVSARTFGEVIVTPDLRLTTNISLDLQDNYNDTYDNPIVGDGIPGGRASRTIARTTSYTWNQLATYSKKIGDHNISALAGHENYDYSYNNLIGSRITQVVDGITELANFSTVSGVNSYTDNARIESYLSKLTYDYQGKYLLSGSFRRDGNSKFSRLVRWDNFWSVGAAWRVEKEAFMSNIAWVDLLKVRTSYGKVGNDQFPNTNVYPYQSFYNLGRNNANEPGVYYSTLGNDSLTWETSKTFDLGVEFSFFKSRLSGSIEYFNRKTDGLIFSVPQPLSAGGNLTSGLTINTNIGSLWNRGVELQITGDVFRTRNFRWTATLNATKFNNRITKMPPKVPFIIDGTKRLEVGRSIYDFYLRQYYGVDSADGAALWKNPIAYSAANCRIIDNGKGGRDTVTTLFSNAQQVYSNQTSIPKVYGSIGNTFSYKGFDLSFLLVYQLGGKVYDGVYASLMSAGTLGTTLHTDMLNRWQKPGDVTNVPRLDYAQRSTYNTASDRFLIDASYIALNNVNFGYTLPVKVAGKIGGRSARVYVSGENLFLFSKRKGMNPATNFAGTTSDNFSLARVLTAGINVNF